MFLQRHLKEHCPTSDFGGNCNTLIVPNPYYITKLHPGSSSYLLVTYPTGSRASTMVLHLPKCPKGSSKGTKGLAKDSQGYPKLPKVKMRYEGYQKVSSCCKGKNKGSVHDYGMTPLVLSTIIENLASK